jgi:hypothetical protein
VNCTLAVASQRTSHPQAECRLSPLIENARIAALFRRRTCAQAARNVRPGNPTCRTGSADAQRRADRGSRRRVGRLWALPDRSSATGCRRCRRVAGRRRGGRVVETAVQAVNPGGHPTLVMHCVTSRTPSCPRRASAKRGSVRPRPSERPESTELRMAMPDRRNPRQYAAGLTIRYIPDRPWIVFLEWLVPNRWSR